MTFKRIRDPLYGFVQADDQDLGLIDHYSRWVEDISGQQPAFKVVGKQKPPFGGLMLLMFGGAKPYRADKQHRTEKNL